MQKGSEVKITKMQHRNEKLQKLRYTLSDKQNVTMN